MLKYPCLEINRQSQVKLLQIVFSVLLCSGKPPARKKMSACLEMLRKNI